MSRTKKVVLLVDDQEQQLSQRRFVIENWGYRVLSANSAAGAVEILDQAAPESLDLLICRSLLGDMRGEKLLQRARQRHSELPAILFCEARRVLDCYDRSGVLVTTAVLLPAELKERMRTLMSRKRGPRTAPARIYHAYDLRRTA